MEEHEPDGPSPVDMPKSGVKTSRLKLGQKFRFYRGESIELELSGEARQILSELMNQTSHGAEELFIRGLILYKASVDAVAEGKRVAILDEDGEIDQEITGF